MDYLINALDVVLRAILSVAFLFFITRFMGRKQISQLSFFDYIIGISIGSIAAAMCTGQEVQYLHGFIAMSVYSLMALGISIATNKSIKLRRFFNGRAYILIYKGKILNKNLEKVRYDINDLLSEARYAGYFNIADIEYAIMETSGRISYLPKAQKTNVVQEDLSILKPQEGLVANVVIDGNIMIENLKFVGLDESWLKSELKKQGNYKIKDILLATVDDNNSLSVYLKTDKLVDRNFIE